MPKDLKEMTLEELWVLFPIKLEEHKSEWRDWAIQEIDLLYALLSGYKPVINHIGSTAIPGIYAKPIIDLLVEISPEIKMDELKILMENNGYICMSFNSQSASFNKGYTLNGYAEKVFHIHFRSYGENDQIKFKDYLIKHPGSAKQYETLKLSLLSKYRNNRDAYTDAKSDFIKKILLLSRLFPNN